MERLRSCIVEETCHRGVFGVEGAAQPNNKYLSSNEKEEMENRLVKFGRVLDALLDDTAADKGMEIFETFPDPLLQHLNLDENKAEDWLVSNHGNDWVEKRTRPVWGWKRAKHLAIAV